MSKSARLRRNCVQVLGQPATPSPAESVRILIVQGRTVEAIKVLVERGGCH